MQLNYIKIALRNLWKHKSQTFINVLGLALGLASSIIIYFILEHELNFDKFHTKADQIYRITSVSNYDGEQYFFNGVPKPLPAAFRQDFGQDIDELLILELIEQANSRIQINGQTILLDKGRAFTENAYFKMLDFPLLSGNPATVLSQPNEVVLSASLSTQLFGSSEAALGKTFTFFRFDDTYELQVTGIMQDPPVNTDFQFEMLISYSTQGQQEFVWDGLYSSFNVFVQLPESTSVQYLESQFEQFVIKHAGEEIIEEDEEGLRLQPLSEIHYDNRYPGFPYHKTSDLEITALILLSIILIVLACINFINLATAISTQRAKEVGIRKTLGSSRRQIILHFLGEAFLVTVFAVLLALGLSELGLIHLKKWYTHLEAVSIHFSWYTILFLLLLVSVVTNLAGLYPGWLLSRFQPVHMFKKDVLLVRKQKFSLREVLVVFQFFIAQVFIVCTLVIAQQLDFLKHAPLGFDKEAILTVELKDQNPQHRERLETVLQKESSVQNLTFSAFMAISQSMAASMYALEGQEPEKGANLQYADHRFFDTHGMQLLAGAVYTPSDSGSGYIVNEAFVKDIGLQHPEEALGKYISIDNLELPIVGVVADYHTRDFRSKVPPLVISNYSPEYHNLSIKVDLKDVAVVLKKIEETWKLMYPEHDFSYAFMDEQVARFYQSYDRNFSLAQLFAGIAIFISCLGLYGLVLFMAQRKTKEIGIRKVLGATVSNIISIFSKEFVKLIVFAFVLAAPLAYYLMQQWLNDFAYKIEVGLLTFTSALLLTLLLVLLTVGYQSIKAALANPVDSLRNE
jgi:ABC-type antimicrobial peptide transport system permease subunit